jgi:pimeloyl-ACP methyl ester carboxylesterase
MSAQPRRSTAIEREKRSAFLGMQERYLAQHGTVARRHEVQLVRFDLRASVLEAGAGEPLLLLHGGGASAIILEPLLSRLQSHFHLYAPDRPGCGLTDGYNYQGVPLREHARDFVRAVLDSFGITQVTLLGSSVGGYFSLVFALAYPERVRKLILLGAPTGIDRRVPPVFIPLGIPYINRLLYRPSVGLMRMTLHQLVADRRKLPANIHQVAYAVATLPGAKASWLSLLEELITLGRLDPRHYIRDELTQLDIPTLFIWGDEDYFAHPSSGAQCCAMMPQARIEILHRVGHLVWMDQLERCAELIVAFLLSARDDRTS